MNLQDNPNYGGIDFAAVIDILKSRWKPIVLMPVLAIVFAIIYLNMTPAKYEARMRVIPTSTSSGDGLSGKLSQFGGLAAAAGVSLPDGGGSSSFKLYVEALHSRDVAEILARDPEIMHAIFNREWDADSQQWRAPQGLIVDTSKAVKSLIGLPNRPWAEPGPARLQQWMAQNISVEQNMKSPVVTVSLLGTDAEFSVKFLGKLSKAIDNMLRERALLRTNDYISYLTTRLPTITLLEQRAAIAQALGEQERVKMVASSTRPYAAEMFEHSAASDRPVTPKPLKILAISTILGLIAGLAWAFVIPARKSSIHQIQ